MHTAIFHWPNLAEIGLISWRKANENVELKLKLMPATKQRQSQLATDRKGGPGKPKLAEMTCGLWPNAKLGENAVGLGPHKHPHMTADGGPSNVTPAALRKWPAQGAN